MTQGHLLADIGAVLVNVAFAVSAAFPVVTGAYWPWWASWWGRNIVGLEICIAATLLPATLYRDFGIDSFWLRWISLVSLAAVIAVVVWRAVMIWVTQRNGLDWDPLRGYGKRDRFGGPSFSRFRVKFSDHPRPRLPCPACPIGCPIWPEPVSAVTEYGHHGRIGHGFPAETPPAGFRPVHSFAGFAARALTTPHAT